MRLLKAKAPTALAVIVMSIKNTLHLKTASFTNSGTRLMKDQNKHQQFRSGHKDDDDDDWTLCSMPNMSKISTFYVLVARRRGHFWQGAHLHGNMNIRVKNTFIVS